MAWSMPPMNSSTAEGLTLHLVLMHPSNRLCCGENPRRKPLRSSELCRRDSQCNIYATGNRHQALRFHYVFSRGIMQLHSCAPAGSHLWPQEMWEACSTAVPCRPSSHCCSLRGARGTGESLLCRLLFSLVLMLVHWARELSRRRNCLQILPVTSLLCIVSWDYRSMFSMVWGRVCKHALTSACRVPSVCISTVCVCLRDDVVILFKTPLSAWCLCGMQSA